MKRENKYSGLDITPGLRRRLKKAAARESVTIREYCLSAIEQQLDREESGMLVFGAFNRQSVQGAKALQEAVFGRRRLAGESAELIYSAREERGRGR